MKRGGGRTSFSHAEGGGSTKSFGVVFTFISFSHIEGGHKEFPLFKRLGGKQVLPCLDQSLNFMSRSIFLRFNRVGLQPLHPKGLITLCVVPGRCFTCVFDFSCVFDTNMLVYKMQEKNLKCMKNARFFSSILRYK